MGLDLNLDDVRDTVRGGLLIGGIAGIVILSQAYEIRLTSPETYRSKFKQAGLLLLFSGACGLFLLLT